MKRINNIRKITAIVMIAVLMLAAVPICSAASYDTTGAATLVFSDSGIKTTGSGFTVEGTALKITESGTYVLSGSCKNGSVVVKKNVTGVTLVLNGLTLTASATAAITCNKGSEVTIVAAAGTVNNLADDKLNNDDNYNYENIENAVIKCKDGSNVTICGTGTVNVTANGKNGVKGGADLYDETDSSKLVSEASLTIKELTLNVTANVNDGIKADKVLNILSGKITVSAADDGIKSDYTLNIGANNTEGPTVTVKQSTEGIEAATVNVFSGKTSVNATDDGINAANSDLDKYSFSYNQYGGSVYINVTNGDGIDSNGTINLNGGTLEVYSPAQGDGDPLDAENGTNFKGATVLAVGHLGMQQGYSATTPYVVFGSTATGMGGGFGRTSGSAAAIVSADGKIEITDASGNVIYSAKAVRNASYVLFSSPKLKSGAQYTLGSATASATTDSTSGGMGGFGGMQRPGGNSATQGSGKNGGMQRPDMSGGTQTPDSDENGGTFTPPEKGDSQFPGFGESDGTLTPPENGDEQFPGFGESDGKFTPRDKGEHDGLSDDGNEQQSVQGNWFVKIIKAIKKIISSIFKKKQAVSETAAIS